MISIKHPRFVQCQLPEDDAKSGRLQTERSLSSAQRRSAEVEGGEGARRKVPVDDVPAKASATAAIAHPRPNANQHVQTADCEAAEAKVRARLSRRNTGESSKRSLNGVRNNFRF